MKETPLYSVRMRAAQGGSHELGGKHISGGEVISSLDELRSSVDLLIKKALTHSRGVPDFLQIQCDAITEPIQFVPPLKVHTNTVETITEGQYVAKELLQQNGISAAVIEKAYEQLPQFSQSGALLIDAKTGKRINGEQSVRVSKMDWNETNFISWVKKNEFMPNERLKEALVLATKVSYHPATVAELCWSDDPDYVTGYVASKALGYQRITKMKEWGDDQGCRIFFVNTAYDIDTYISYLKTEPLFVYWEENDGT